MDFARGCCQRAAQADRLAKNNPSSSAIAMRRALPLAFDPELSSLIALAVLSRASSSMGFPILAIDETFMNRRRSFERSLVKRSNYGPARFAKTRAGNLTIFMGPRLPYYLACSWLKKSMIERMRSRTASSDPQGRSRKESSSLSPFHRRHDSFWNFATVLAQRRGSWDRRRFVPATPNRHFRRRGELHPYFFVDHLINGSTIEAPVIALRQQGQIHRFGFELGA